MIYIRILTLLVLLSVCSFLLAGGQTLTPIYDRPLAPNFALPDMQGRTITLSDYRGEVVVVNFWASWCPPCVEEMKSMQHGAGWLAKYQGRFIAINMGEEPEVVAEFLTGRGFEIPVLLDKDSTISSRWGVQRLPATYVVDPQGRLAYQALGARHWDDPELLVPLRSLTMERQ